MARKNFREITVANHEMYKVLASSCLCVGMNMTEVKILIPFFLTVSVPADSVVCEEGDEESFMCLIMSGSVDIVKGLGLKSKQVIATLGAGDAIGELSLVDPHPRSASVVTTEDTILFSLTRRNFKELYNTNCDAWCKATFNIATLLATRLRATTDGLAESLSKGSVSALKQHDSFFSGRPSLTDNEG